MDKDRDLVPAAMDVDDNLPHLINSVVVDFSGVHLNKLRVRVAEELPVVHVGASVVDGATSYPAPMEPAGRKGSWRIYEINVSRPGDVRISLGDIHTGWLRIELARPDDFTSVRYVYDGGHVAATWDFPVETIVPGTTKLILTTIDVLPAIEAGLSIGQFLTNGLPATPAHVMVDAATAAAFIVAEMVLVQYVESSDT